MAEYIDKHEAYTLLKDLEAAYIYPPVREAYGKAARRIDQMKAADVQPVKHGRWVQYNRNGEETYIECTNCCVPSRPRHLQMVTRSGEGLPDYCPNCGARMDGDTNG